MALKGKNIYYLALYRKSFMEMITLDNQLYYYYYFF